MDDDKIVTFLTDCVLHVGNISWKDLDIKPFHKYVTYLQFLCASLFIKTMMFIKN